MQEQSSAAISLSNCTVRWRGRRPRAEFVSWREVRGQKQLAMRKTHFSSRAHNHMRKSGKVMSSNNPTQLRVAFTIMTMNTNTIGGTGTLVFTNAVSPLLNSASFLLSISDDTSALNATHNRNAPPRGGGRFLPLRIPIARSAHGVVPRGFAIRSCFAALSQSTLRTCSIRSVVLRRTPNDLGHPRAYPVRHVGENSAARRNDAMASAKLCR